jgi:uncharacterized membrane protein
MNKRIYLIDELRGLSIVLMVIFHIIYQLVLWLSMPEDILYNPIVRLIQFEAQFLFISIAGVSCSFSRNNLKRGIICMVYGTIITIITYLFIPEERIILGILHFMGLAILIYTLLKNQLIKIKPIIGFPISLFLFILSYIYIITYNTEVVTAITKVKSIHYLWSKGFLTLLGMPAPNFYSSDFFPLLPWLFLFLSGSFLGIIIKNQNDNTFISKSRIPVLSFLGRHSLTIYLMHIPIIVLTLFSIKYMFKI